MNEPRGTLTVRGPDTCDPWHRSAKPVAPPRTRVSARSAGAPCTAFVLADGAALGAMQALTATRTTLAAHDTRPARARAS